MLQVIKAEEVRDGEPRWWLADEDYRLDYMKPEHLHLHPRSCEETTHAIVDRPAPTPPPAPGLDLDAVERSASSFAKYHTEHARFGGASREFHERAETFIGATVPALIAEVRALRAAIAEAKRLGLEACALADGGIDEPLDATAVERIGAKTAAIAAALEAL